MSTFSYELYLVTDEKACLGRDLFWIVEEAVKGGVDLVQLREKELSHGDFLQRARKLKKLLDRYSIPLIINDNLEIAKTIGALGVHVGVNDVTPQQIRKVWRSCECLGYSIEYLDQIESSEVSACDYVAASPVFSTPTKTNTMSEWGLAGVSKIKSLTSTPLVAIGGINISNAAAIIQAGADCLAIVSGICSAKDPRVAAESFKKEIQYAKRKTL